MLANMLPVALHMIDLFAKWLSTEVATLTGGVLESLGRHQLLTATDKLYPLLGVHVVGGSGAEVLSEISGL